MRELTLLETGYLSGGLLLCLALPLLMSFRGPQGAAARRPCMKTVWTGQMLLACAGLAVLASAPVAPYAAALGLLGYSVCIFVLMRQLRAARME